MVQVTIIEEASSGCGIFSFLFWIWLVLCSVTLIGAYFSNEENKKRFAEILKKAKNPFSTSEKTGWFAMELNPMNKLNEMKVTQEGIIKQENVCIPYNKILNDTEIKDAENQRLIKEAEEKRIAAEEKLRIFEEKLAEEQREKERAEKKKALEEKHRKLAEELKKLEEEKIRIINENSGTDSQEKKSC